LDALQIDVVCHDKDRVDIELEEEKIPGVGVPLEVDNVLDALLLK